MSLEMLKDLLKKNADNPQAQQNLLRMFALIKGQEFKNVSDALSA